MLNCLHQKKGKKQNMSFCKQNSLTVTVCLNFVRPRFYRPFLSYLAEHSASWSHDKRKACMSLFTAGLCPF